MRIGSRLPDSTLDEHTGTASWTGFPDYGRSSLGEMLQKFASFAFSTVASGVWYSKSRPARPPPLLGQERWLNIRMLAAPPEYIYAYIFIGNNYFVPVRFSCAFLRADQQTGSVFNV